MNKPCRYFLSFFLCLFIFCLCNKAVAQDILDSAGKRVTLPPPSKKTKRDSLFLSHSPKKAGIRSAIIPGWGQAYNRRYWKIPIVYGALGVSGGVFVYNVNWYKRTRFAYKTLFNRDTANYQKIHPLLQGYVLNNDAAGLQYNRNEFRRNVDYSVLVFLLLWGLNVIDATVDAHLRTFDVSPDLSLQLKAGYSDIAKTNGISLVFTFK